MSYLLRKFCLLVKNKERVKKPLLYDHYLRSFLVNLEM